MAEGRTAFISTMEVKQAHEFPRLRGKVPRKVIMRSKEWGKDRGPIWAVAKRS
jgi:hypothetical protein